MQAWGASLLSVHFLPPQGARNCTPARLNRHRNGIPWRSEFLLGGCCSSAFFHIEVNPSFRPKSKRSCATSEYTPKWGSWDTKESIALLLSSALGDDQGPWFPAELSSSYLWFKVVLKNVFPIFMALQAWQGPSNLLAVPVEAPGGRLVLWNKRGKPEANPRRFYGSCADDMTMDKFAGYLPVVSSTTVAWYPPKYQLSLPAPPVPWQLRTWSDIAAARLQLLVALEAISTELDWHLSSFKSRMRPPNWLEDMDHSYGFSIVSLIGVGYWVQGFRCFPWLAMNYYMKDGLQLDPVALQCLQNTVNLPYLAKPLYGIVSDSVYICGGHRVPYIIIAGILQVLSWGTIVAIPGARRSAVMLTGFLTFGNLGAAVADVANDALVAETGKRAGKDGQLQSFAWLASAAGGLLGNFLSGLALTGMAFDSMFFIFVLCLTGHVTIAFMVSEQRFGSKAQTRDLVVSKGTVSRDVSDGREGRSRSSRKSSLVRNRGDRKQQHIVMKEEVGERERLDIPKQLSVLFGLIKSPTILYPLLWFMGSYAVIPTLSGSIFYYQSQALQINPFFLGLSKMLGQGGLLAGSLLYERYLKPVPLRKLVGCVQVLLSLCILADIGLVCRTNLQLGIPDQLYILGASAFVDAINQFKVLPFMVFFAKLCPAGSEGSLLAVFMSCQCLACLVGGYLGAALAAFLDISSTNFANLPAGILVQAMAALVPMVGIMLLPGEEAATKVEKVA